jgi:hypothetical protein
MRRSVCVAAGVLVLGGGAAAYVAPAVSAGGREARPAAVAAPALGAVRLVSRSGLRLAGRWQGWADASLMPTVPGRVRVVLSGCPAMRRAAGCVYSKRPRVIYLRSGLRDPRGVLLHELGHVYDLRVLNNRDRGRFRRIMGRSAKRRWWRGSLPPAEQFAEANSWCARYARIVSIARYSSYAPAPVPPPPPGLPPIPTPPPLPGPH